MTMTRANHHLAHVIAGTSALDDLQVVKTLRQH